MREKFHSSTPTTSQQAKVVVLVTLLAAFGHVARADAQSTETFMAQPAMHDAVAMPQRTDSGDANVLALAGQRAVHQIVTEMQTSNAVTFGIGQQASSTKRRSWAARHPVLVGTMIGLPTGWLIGYLPGDDGVFYDFTAEFNGMVMGAIGAGTGALIGAIVGEIRK